MGQSAPPHREDRTPLARSRRTAARASPAPTARDVQPALVVIGRHCVSKRDSALVIGRHCVTKRDGAPVKYNGIV